MRKLRIIEHMSLDGVIQAPGGPDEDPAYPYGGWSAPFHDDEAGAAIVAAQSDRFDLLLGRRTYDIFGGFWPRQSGSIATRLNEATKYVATHRPDSLMWGPVSDLGANIVDGIRRAKAMDGPDIIVWGSSTLTSSLLEHGLADDLVLLVFPVLLGTGKRIFSTSPPRELSLIGSKSMASGVVVSTYAPRGALRMGTVGERDAP